MSGYTYIFVRQDLSKEQIAVQAAHATMQMGFQYALKSERGFDLPNMHARGSSPSETYFILVGVRNEEALLAVESILSKFDISYERFIEPDIGEQVTAIATYPLNKQDRGPLLAFNLLKM